MSNCVVGSGGSRLPCSTIAEHSVEGCDHFSHDGDYRFAANNPDQYQPLTKELIRLQPDVLLAYTTPVAAAFERESRTIPIVFVNVSDPIGSGLVASLARPGGNLTGLLLYEEGITGKWLAMLKEIAPGLSRAALIA